MVCPINKIIVQLEKRFSDELSFASGLKLYQETKFRPEHHVTTVGKVLSVPEHLSDKPDNIGLVPEIQVGDDAVFNYQVVYDVDDLGQHTNLVSHNGKEYWFVDYSQVFCVKRNGLIIPIGSHVILDEVMNDNKETFEGSQILMPDSMREPVKKGIGIIKHIGTPLTTEPVLDLKAGDIVSYRPEIAQVYEMYGQQQVIVKQNYLLAKAI